MRRLPIHRNLPKRGRRRKRKSCRFDHLLDATKKVKVQKVRKPRAKKIEQFLPQELLFESGKVIVQLPIRTKSEANNFEHWRIKEQRKKTHNALIIATLNPIRSHLTLPCTVTLKRYGPTLLDTFENLPMSFKRIVDCLAEILTGVGKGRGDNDPRITWKAEQEKSPAYGIRITFEF